MNHKVHNLKTWPIFFKPLWEGDKKFECRKDDRGFAVGDTLILEEFDPTIEQYSGRDVMAVVTFIIRECPGLAQGYCIMGIDVFGIRHGEIQAMN